MGTHDRAGLARDGILATFDRATLETAANSVKSAYKSTLGFELSVYSISATARYNGPSN